MGKNLGIIAEMTTILGKKRIAFVRFVMVNSMLSGGFIAFCINARSTKNLEKEI